MEHTSTFKSNTTTATTTSSKEEEEELSEFISTLPKQTDGFGTQLCFYQNFWSLESVIEPLLSFQKHFQARDTDIILASVLKSGTTWLKAVIHLIANRTQYPTLNDSPLFTSSPHEVVPNFEFELYSKTQFFDLESIPEPRIFSTHVPYASLPSSIKNSRCRIVYICRNPLDQLISYWHFASKFPWCKDSPTVEEFFELYCRGIYSFGPFENHVLGYWRASLENPAKLFFLKYEDFKENNITCTKRLAEFLGFSFSVVEEEQGAVEEISKFCSFKNMKNLEGNILGKRPSGTLNSSYFRKGEVEDWRNYLTPLMAEHLEKLIENKLEGTGLSFNMSCKKDA